MRTEPPLPNAPRRDEIYAEVVTEYGAALDRLARGYEADADRRRDLLQEIHLALWQSCGHFDGRCALRTWVYRVAHNVATSHVIRDRRSRRRAFVSLEEVELMAVDVDPVCAIDRRMSLGRLLELIQELAPLDRQVILSYLEGLGSAAIAEITGLSPGNVATKIHRIKNLLARRFQTGGAHGI